MKYIFPLIQIGLFIGAGVCLMLQDLEVFIGWTIFTGIVQVSCAIILTANWWNRTPFPLGLKVYWILAVIGLCLCVTLVIPWLVALYFTFVTCELVPKK